MREVLEAGERPLVLGGDCTLALGVFHALPGGSGLWFVDGHADFFDGESSPTGEAADMDLAILTGHGRPGWSSERDGWSSQPPSSCPGIARPSFTPTSPARMPASTPPSTPSRRPRCASAAPPAWERAPPLGSPRVRHGCTSTSTVLDERVLPAVSYPQARGLDWAELVALARPLVAAPNLLGVSVADFNPDGDADGSYAAHVVEGLASLFTT